MRRETKDHRRERLDQIRAVLKSVYPDAHCELTFRNPLELLVATILSAQCTDLNVNRVTATLFKKYLTATDYAKAPEEELARDLRSLGLFRNKAKNLKAACQRIEERYGGEVPRSMEALIELPGVGRKTANVVLGNAFGLEDGIVVDTHVLRLSRRLGITAETDPVKVERSLVTLVPKGEWTQFSHWLIWHGRRRCAARKPDCLRCELKMLCPSASREKP
ncbi:MAG: endonuclease III [Verrucomicrobiota bacterium]